MEKRIWIWGVELKQPTFNLLTRAALFGAVLFALAAALLRVFDAPVDLEMALLGCYTGAVASEVGLHAHRGLRQLVLFLGLVLTVGLCVRIISMLASG